MTAKKYAFSVAIVALLLGVFASNVQVTGHWETITPVFYTTLSGNQNAFRNEQIGHANDILGHQDNNVNGRISVPQASVANIQGATHVYYNGGQQDNVDSFNSYAVDPSEDGVVVIIVEKIERWNPQTHNIRM